MRMKTVRAGGILGVLLVLLSSCFNIACLSVRLASLGVDLFIQEYARQVSDSWANLIIVVVVFSLLGAAYAVVTTIWLISRGMDASNWFISTPVFLYMGVFPIYCLAYANGSIDTIKNSFVFQCTPTNYQAIGGRCG